MGTIDWQKALREPLLYFFVGGAALYALVDSAAPVVQQRSEVVITRDRLGNLATRFEETSRRAPTPAELESLARSAALEDAMVREARALGLDRGDPIIRRRLVQKVQALMDAELTASAPTDGELQAFMEANADRHALSRRYSFTHVYFSGTGAEERAVRHLRSGAEKPAAGDPFPHGAAFNALSHGAVTSRFGQRFAEALERATPGEWLGPVASPLGFHVVRLRERRSDGLPPLQRVRERVLNDFRADRVARAREEARAALLKRYGYRVEGL